ncbi:MAG: DNA methyltransferase [Candidatus Woesearchaeota archaeon]
MKLINKSSENMNEVADNSANLFFLAPPYHIGTTYGKNEDKRSQQEWFSLMQSVINESNRFLKNNGVVLIEASDTLLWGDRTIQLADYLQAEYVKRGFHVNERHIFFANSKNGVILPEHGWDDNYTTLGNTHSNIGQYIVLSRTNPDFKGGRVFYENYEARDGHPCPSPQNTLDEIASPHISKDSLVVDSFMGIGTMGEIVQKNQGSFVGYELDTTIFNTAKRNLGEK